jgi:hypothetical protein
MTPEDPPIDRVNELLVDRALQGLTAEEQAELARLTDQIEADGLPLELAVAEAELALGESHLDLPDSVRIRLETAADVFFGPSKPRPTARLIVKRSLPWVGWMAAAASLVFALQPPREVKDIPKQPPRQPTLQERLAGVAPRRLSATDHPLARGGSGLVAWSPERQEGYLQIRGLAESDPAQGVYQLWIFDAARDDRFPVDGGTFTITDANATTVIPIRPSLAIRQPTLFAVTLEPPGGVVVSDRKRLLLTAAVTP